MNDVRRRCAIYTRKSSEEGLEQSFNSLDAQREACESYIGSQKHEGWTALAEHYDDGGYSGGNTDRPALQRLMVDVRAGRVDMIVVYKIDRLTRSLTDFSSLVQTLDAHQTSFVSVTQHFNTTTSMGRLTLNVLLSFAQFEREVTGERIRDKIAASKRKGMWMGGTVPFGYRVDNRSLIVEPTDAQQVRHLFKRYTELGSVTTLHTELRQQGVVSRVRTSRRGTVSGGTTFSRGALYLLLQNRVYRGEIVHKGVAHPGQHDAIVSLPLWESAQALMAENRDARHLGTRTKDGSLLAGMVVDELGERLTPTHTNKGGRRYRYYLRRASAEEHTGSKRPRWCLPAQQVEDLVSDEVQRLMAHAALEEELGIGNEIPGMGQRIRTAAASVAAAWSDLSLPNKRRWLLGMDLRVVVGMTGLVLRIGRAAMTAAVLRELGEHGLEPGTKGTSGVLGDVERRINATLIRRGGEIRIVAEDGSVPARPDSQHLTLLRAVAKGRRWYQQLVKGEVKTLAEIAENEGVTGSYVRRILRCGLIAPDLVEQLLDGAAAPQLTIENVRARLPLDWGEQRAIYGVPTR